MIFNETPLKGSYEITLSPISDSRGKFVRYYCKEEFKKIGFDKEFIQFNHSVTNKKGAIRGMHYQQFPHAETKLIRCIKGKVFDVMVDIRPYSKTYKQWFGVEISAENMKMVLIPEGFAHGFQTLTEDCELLYCHTAMYAPDYERGLHHNDPALMIHWPLEITEVSNRDKDHKFINSFFTGVKNNI